MAPGSIDAARALAADRGLVTERLPATIERDSFAPALVGLVNNVLVWGGSRVLGALHGVGTNEWRVVSALGNYPGATARELCDVLGINKSVASKSVALLVESGYVDHVDGRRGSRHLFLTPRGAQLHDALMPIVIERVAILQSRLSAGEVAVLNGLLKKMLDSAEDLQEYERALLAASGDQSPATASTRSAPKGASGR